ncbi:MAG TPA: hydantoinase/oxoprolinase family protein [Candidatus Binatia bacterium]|nr:hydantoinase/oxoprolinase family protein [Candidatus Binatia bacterium]
MPAYAIGIDIGGTFTDCFVTDGTRGWRGKAPTTPRALVDGLLAALDAAAADAGVPLARLLAGAVHLGLGTTAVTNCLAEQAGAPTGLLATAGFGDLWPMARGHRVGRDGMSHPLPTLVPRRRIAEVRERVDRDGRVVVPLDEADAAAAIDRLVGEEGVESLAVCFLWSFRNPAHERRVRDLVRARHPALHVSCSADLLPVLREYERMTTTVLNAYTWRAFSAFMDAVEARLAAAGLGVPVAVMQSNGGTFSVGEARAKPVFLAQSGPVAGVAAAQALAHRTGLADVVTGDMGGTSFDVAVVHDGEAERRVRAELFGLWTGLAMVAVDSIGAGGGSVAWVDVRGCLRVGPRSVGADPGPACYGRGGTEPAVTDALVALGHLDPRNFLGGRLLLDGEAAVSALGRLGARLGLDPEATARGIHRLACEQMTLAVKALLVERGLDPRRFAFLSYGGCGPLFAAPIARALGIRRVLVPALSAVFSAFGAATADVCREATCTLFRALPVDAAEVAAAFAALEREVADAMAAEGVDPARVALRRECDLRFHRQTWEVAVPLADAAPASVARLADDFRARYAALYGTGALAASSRIDLVSCRVVATGRVPRPAPTPAPLGPADPAPAAAGARAAWLPGAGAERTRVPVFDGERLLPGMALVGPALVERRDTTILVPAGDRAAVDGHGTLVLEAAP